MTKLILCYHRVDRVKIDPHELATNPTLFAAQMAILQSHWIPVSLEELIHARHVPNRNFVAVTFDDGYLDNAQSAAPILHRYRIPATFFVATHHTLTGEAFYWDALWQMLAHPRACGKTITVRTRLGKRSFRLPSRSEESKDANWTIRDGPKHARHAAYVTLCTMLQYRDIPERRALLSEISEQARVEYDEVETPGVMTTDDLLSLAVESNFQIQPHTMNHVSIGAVPIERAIAEIAGSVRHLEAVFPARQFRYFAYPYGGRLDARRSLEDALRQAGIIAGFSTRARAIRLTDSELRLPRICVTAQRIDEFGEMLSSAISVASRKQP